MRRARVALLLTILATSAAFAQSVPSIRSDAFTYSEGGSRSLKLHVFRRNDAVEGLRPAILIFHGGGWAYGDAEWAFPRAKHFAERGFAAIAVEYRLSDQKSVTPLDAVSDAKNAVRWTRENADRLRIDPARVAAYGWSAGAHLAISSAIFDSSETKLSTPNALILISPAVSLAKDGWFRRLLLGRAAVDDLDPSIHVRKDLPPTLILQGDVDTVTPLPGVRDFCERSRSLGNTCELEVYEGVGHLFTPAGIPDDGDPRPDSKTQTAAFARVDAFLSKLGFTK
jgi:acetyl esterase/lipase